MEKSPRNADMIAAAIQCVVHAANDETSLELNVWKIRYHAEEKLISLLCTDASGKKAFYVWYFDFSLLYGC